MNIRSAKEWFTILDEKTKEMQVYENTLYNFFMNIHADEDYRTPFMVGCYNKHKFSKSIFRMLFVKTIMLGVLICTCVSYVLIFGRKVFAQKDYNLLDTLKHYGKRYAISSLFVALAVMFLLFGAVLLYKYCKFRLQKRKLAKYEKLLQEIIITVPMNYRTAEKMKTIARCYFINPNIPFNSILSKVDEYFDEVGRESPFRTLMYDLPCNCPYLNIIEDEVSSDVQIENTATIKSEFLPSDIDNKIFTGSEDAQKDLNAMIGLDSVKQQISRFKNRITFYGKDSNNGCHMAFLGSAGTGKTSCARIVTKILFDLGYIKKNQYIEISGDYLCAGNTSRASAIIEYSYGGVLFIDEAYLMYNNGPETVGVLLKAMEDHRKEFVVILAGYEEQMTKLFASNEGFNSRIKHTIYFADYTEDELLDIFNYFIKSYNGKEYRLSEDAIPVLRETFAIEKKSQNFGNARTVRNAVDMIMDYHADRCMSEGGNPQIITSADVLPYSNDRKTAIQHELKNTSAVNQFDEKIIRLADLKTRMKSGSETPTPDLQRMVGLSSLKNELMTLKHQIEFYGKPTTQKILLIGEPSCGKSTCIPIITGALYRMGYIQENKYLEVSAEFFKGSYVGHTAKRSEAIISYAAGGVLYIKNINMLAQQDDDYALEALTVIQTAINSNEDITIIVADTPSTYLNNMRNQFTMVYEFPQYTNEELLQIMESVASGEGFYITEDAKAAIAQYLNTYTVNVSDILHLYTRLVKNHINNYNGNEETKFTLSVNDIDF